MASDVILAARIDNEIGEPHSMRIMVAE